MEQLSPKHVFPAPDVVRTRSAEAGARIYLLDGRWHFARYGSVEEQELAERGGLHVADLRFDPDPHDARHSGRTVHALDSRRAVRTLAAAGKN